MRAIVSNLCVYWIFIILSVLFIRTGGVTTQRMEKDDDDTSWLRDRTRFPWNFTLSARPTVRPWPKYTVPLRGDYNYRSSHSEDDTTIKLIIFIPVAVVLLIILLCKYLICNENDCCETSTYTEEPTLHAPPPRNINMPRTENWSAPSSSNSNIRRFHTPSMTGTREGMLWHTTSNTAPTAPNITLPYEVNPPGSSRENNYAHRTSNMDSSPSDKPPDYSVVVISGLNQKEKFPEVQPAQNLPPPKYNETNLMKF